MPPFVAAFDVATRCGVCLGRVGGKPVTETWDMREGGPSRSRRLLWFSDRCDAFFREHSIDCLRYEAPLEIAVASRIGASEETLLLLRGAIGVLECCGARANIKDIQAFDVKDAREHLVGRRTFPKDSRGRSTAKGEVMRMAKVLGVVCQDENASDAFAGWSHACALLNPRIAHLVTPLFAGTS